jgi:hypothetical protein
MNVEECITLNMLPSLYNPTDKEIVEINNKRKEMRGESSQPTIATTSGGSTPPPPPAMSQYMVYDNGQQTGPFSIPQLQQMIAAGTLTKQTYVWKNGMANWEYAGSVVELSSLFVTNTPPPPPPMM